MLRHMRGRVPRDALPRTLGQSRLRGRERALQQRPLEDDEHEHDRDRHEQRVGRGRRQFEV